MDSSISLQRYENLSCEPENVAELMMELVGNLMTCFLETWPNFPQSFLCFCHDDSNKASFKGISFGKVRTCLDLIIDALYTATVPTNVTITMK